MKPTKRMLKSFYIFVGVLTISSIIMTLLSGFQYEHKKFTQLVFTLICNMLMRFILLEHIAFPIQILALTKIAKEKETKMPIPKKLTEIFTENKEHSYNEMDYLKLRLESLKAQLFVSSCHKDESLNLEFKLLTQDFWLFGKYFILVLLLIVYTQSPLGYYNTATMRTILNESHFTNYSLENVNTIKELYSWINDTLTGALNEGQNLDGSPINEPGWVHFHLAKLLGVVRLQQIRHSKKTGGMLKLYFDEKDYLPQWKPLKRQLHYTDKYWRIYYPWLSKRYDGVANWLMSCTHFGSLYSYPENNGYVAVLARNQKNSEKIVKFLKENQWLDANTAAVFIDFTLYNTDSNMFTSCSTLVEQTPFGNLVWQISVQSAELLTNLDEISMWRWGLIVLYILQLVQLCKAMFVKAWVMSSFFKSRWNCVDFTIIILNLVLFILKLIREYYVYYVMQSFVASLKLEYVDFRVASLFDYMTMITMGFLVCLISLRIWKLLQFSSIFRIFNRTLYTSAGAIFATIVGIHIFLLAIGLSAQIVNGSHTEIFSRYLKSVTSIMSFSFGFNSRTSPDDLNHGGGALGFILYLILMFVVAIFLINMFITLICDHFANAREERDKQAANQQLTYWQFLNMEYVFIIEFYKNLFPRYYKRQEHSVTENIKKKLNDLELKSLKQENSINVVTSELNEDQIFKEDMLGADRVQKISAILQLQIEILQRHIMLEYLEMDLEDEESDK